MSQNYKIYNKDAAYFLTMTTVGWIDLFRRPNHKLLLINALKYCQQFKGLELYAYCIMTSHVHLIARATGHYSLSAILRDFKKFTSKRLIEQIKNEPESRREWMLELFGEAAQKIKRNKNYKVWQDGNQPKEIFSNEFFWQKLDYIHRNPLEELFVKNPEDYLFSSARNYAELDSYLEIVLESGRMITYN
jgi:REP element-mobilizing transposase RayT